MESPVRDDLVRTIKAVCQVATALGPNDPRYVRMVALFTELKALLLRCDSGGQSQHGFNTMKPAAVPANQTTTTSVEMPLALRHMGAQFEGNGSYGLGHASSFDASLPYHEYGADPPRTPYGVSPATRNFLYGANLAGVSPRYGESLPAASAHYGENHPAASAQYGENHPAASAQYGENHPAASAQYSTNLPAASPPYGVNLPTATYGGNLPAASSQYPASVPAASSQYGATPLAAGSQYGANPPAGSSQSPNFQYGENLPSSNYDTSGYYNYGPGYGP